MSKLDSLGNSDSGEHNYIPSTIGLHLSPPSSPSTSSITQQAGRPSLVATTGIHFSRPNALVTSENRPSRETTRNYRALICSTSAHRRPPGHHNFSSRSHGEPWVDRCFWNRSFPLALCSHRSSSCRFFKKRGFVSYHAIAQYKKVSGFNARLFEEYQHHGNEE